MKKTYFQRRFDLLTREVSEMEKIKDLVDVIKYNGKKILMIKNLDLIS